MQKLARFGIAAPRGEPRPGLGDSRSGQGCRGEGAVRVVRRADRLHLGDQGSDARLGKILEGRGHQDGAFHRQGQHRFPLHRVPVDAARARRLYLAGERAGQRVPESGGRKDLDVAELGGVAARIPRRVSGQGRRAALRVVRQCAGNQGQRFHVEGFPDAQQQRPCSATSSTARWC